MTRAIKAVRRLLLVFGVVAVSAGAGSALLASPAFAGGVDPNSGILSAAIYNTTPYNWTLVGSGAPQGAGFAAGPAQTVQAGGGFVYQLNPWQRLTGGICGGYYEDYFDEYMTYEVDVLGGPPEYVTVAISGSWNDNLCLNGGQKSDPAFNVYISSSPPPAGYDPSTSTAPTDMSNPQITYTHNQPYLYDQYFQVLGNFTVDASTNLGAPFVNVLNTLCTDAKSSACSFTPTGPLTWGTGDVSAPYVATHCGPGSPNFSIGYTATHSATLSVGGSLTVGTQVTILDVESNALAISVEAQHQWTQTKAVTRTSSVDIPPQEIAHLWVIPTVGKTVGTLVVTNGSATFTATNFTQLHEGVTRDSLSPAYDVVTKVRPMTPAELASHCTGSLGSTLRGAHASKPPVKLVPGHGVGHVSLGQTQAQVVHALGRARHQRYLVRPCQGLGRDCDAVTGTGGRWTYRDITVVFGHDTRVSGLIYRGRQRSSRGAGVGLSEPVIRGSHPRTSCSLPARGRKDCTLVGTNGGRTVKTVFGFIRRSGGLYQCDRVRIYAVNGASS